MVTAGMVEVKNWLLQFGSGAEVLAPEGLREAYKQEIETMRGTYHHEKPQ